MSSVAEVHGGAAAKSSEKAELTPYPTKRLAFFGIMHIAALICMFIVFGYIMGSSQILPMDLAEENEDGAVQFQVLMIEVPMAIKLIYMLMTAFCSPDYFGTRHKIFAVLDLLGLIPSALGIVSLFGLCMSAGYSMQTPVFIGIAYYAIPTITYLIFGAVFDVKVFSAAAKSMRNKFKIAPDSGFSVFNLKMAAAAIAFYAAVMIVGAYLPVSADKALYGEDLSVSDTKKLIMEEMLEIDNSDLYYENFDLWSDFYQASCTERYDGRNVYITCELVESGYVFEYKAERKWFGVYELHLLTSLEEVMES